MSHNCLLARSTPDAVDPPCSPPLARGDNHLFARRGVGSALAIHSICSSNHWDRRLVPTNRRLDVCTAARVAARCGLTIRRQPRAMLRNTLGVLGLATPTALCIIAPVCGCYPRQSNHPERGRRTQNDGACSGGARCMSADLSTVPQGGDQGGGRAGASKSPVVPLGKGDGSWLLQTGVAAGVALPRNGRFQSRHARSLSAGIQGMRRERALTAGLCIDS